MSVYNFSDHESSEPAGGHRTTTNGTASRHHHHQQAAGSYHQMESEFLSRNLAATQAAASSQPDNSVQLTRPISKTALLVKNRRAMLEQLSCFICKGYLIDATTLDECMDSFCKSCIIQHLRLQRNCPKCNVVIPHNNPLNAMRPDKVLQDIVYKLIPGLYDDEMKRRREFYKEYYGVDQRSQQQDEDEDDENSDGSSTGTSLTIEGTNLSGERYGVILHPKPFYKPTDSIDLSIEPQTRGDQTTIYYDNKRQSIVTCFTGSLAQRDLNNEASGAGAFSSVDSQLFKTYLRCPAKFTVLQLKKFIAAKFNICRDDTIRLLYLNESLCEEYSLIDVAYIYDWRGIEHMQLFYIIERDLMRVNTSDQHQDNHSRAGRATTTRQSVGISTQTVKRVCIDPKPKFYEEKNNNSIGVSTTEGRSMRPRNSESPAMSNGTTKAAMQATSPIIRTSAPNGREQRSFSIQTNGVSTREHQASSRVNHSGLQGSSDTRSLRSQASAFKPTPATRAETHEAQPKITINSSATSSTRSNLVTQERVRNVATAAGTQVNSKPVKHLVPYSAAVNGFGSSAATANATQSSFVTMASFTEAKTSNLITSVSSTSASVQTLINDQHQQADVSSFGQPDYPSVMKVNPASRVQATPQLAFSFVTERGITIVRRVNNQDETTPISAVPPTKATANQSLMPRSSVGGPIYSEARTSTIAATGYTGGQVNHHHAAQTSTSNLNIISSQPVSQPHTQSSSSSSSHRVQEDSVTSRHNLKAKPVYKLFPDPTKLKSPNLKKLGYTARH